MRVAHLIVLGADPRRTMLLTFSRRAIGSDCAQLFSGILFRDDFLYRVSEFLPGIVAA